MHVGADVLDSEINNGGSVESKDLGNAQTANHSNTQRPPGFGTGAEAESEG